MTIEQRIEKLECQNRRLRWTVTGLVGAVVAALIMGQAAATSGGPEAANIIRARRIEIVNAEGQPAVVLGMTTNNAGTIMTMGAKGEKLVNLGVTTNGEGLISTGNRKGNELVKIGVTTDGDGMLGTYSAKGLKLLEVGVTTKGDPKIYSYKPDGSPKHSWP